MLDWLITFLGCVCGTLGLVTAITQFWALYRIRKIAVGSLTGLDWLDIVLRLERGFGITLTRTDFETIPEEDRPVLTAGKLWEVVQAKMQASGQPVPEDGWDRVAAALTEALRVRGSRVQPESRLCADLGMSQDSVYW